MNGSILLTPLDAYNSELKQKHKYNVSVFFESLVDQVKTDRDANKKTIKDINEIKQKIEELNKKKRGNGFLKFLLIFGVIAFAISIIVLWYLYFIGNIKVYIAIIDTFASVGIFLLFGYLLRKISRKIRDLNKQKEKLEEELNRLTELSWQQMAALNKLYDWSMAAKLANKTIPLLELDDNFNPKRYELLNQKYGFGENKDVNKSAVFVQSGSILGNPFVLSTYNIQEWGKKQYTGHLVISWVERYRDSNGNMRTRSRTQTLYATIEKPAPVYHRDTKLIYGNDAAPNLSFSRLQSGALGKSEKQIENMVNKEIKQIDKMAKKAVIKQTGYTKIGNDEFESLFGGEDRDNEMEFRLLFTPLAQTNFIKLIKSQEPFGDDFALYKRKKINIVRSYHSQNFNYECNPNMFVSNSYEDAKAKFEGYCNNYFEALYFDFAPLLSIPIYQQYKTRDYIYKNDYPSNVTSYEHEALANSFNQKLLLDPSSRTMGILKTTFNGRNGKADNVDIVAHSFKTVERVEYVSKMGGDGRTHAVPVHWDEYIPVSKTTKMEIKEERTTRSDFIDHANDQDFVEFLDKASLKNSFSYRRSLLAVLIKDSVDQSTLNNFSNCLRSIEKPLDETLDDFDDSELRAKLGNDVVSQTIDIVKDIDKSNE